MMLKNQNKIKQRENEYSSRKIAEKQKPNQLKIADIMNDATE